ncbi:cytochrome d ubiquinol oxidase subunit II [Bacillus sp. DJP31]|uniref:cytochrome d ubiquinol oxidase subunit II n=1 Tax=Bacillus sp. DJP31 TaxID=3409789 RepID=UPI003BB4FAD4
MTDVLLAITLLWSFIFIYAVAATIDFGAGFWSMFYINRQKKTKATNIANRYLSPSWKITNVFIVLIVVALVTLFPGAAFSLGTVLLLPASFIVLLLALRSAFLVFSHAVKDYQRMLSYVSGISGFLIPALLILTLPISQGGFIEIIAGVEQLQLGKLLSSPHAYAFIGFAVSSTLFLSSLLLADYSNASDAEETYYIYRKDAIILGPVTLLMAFFIVQTMQFEATWMYNNLLEHVPWLIASVALFALGYSALFMSSTQGKALKGRPRLAVVAIILQYLAASYAYGRAHLPYIVYPNVTIESSFTDPNTFRAMFIVYIISFAILIPGFIYFWKLFMKDKRYLKQKES